jgi:hypothetical protein
MNPRTLEILSLIKNHETHKIKTIMLNAANDNNMSRGESMRLDTADSKKEMLYTLYKMLDEMTSSNPNNCSIATAVIKDINKYFKFDFNGDDAKIVLAIFDNFDTLFSPGA